MRPVGVSLLRLRGRRRRERSARNTGGVCRRRLPHGRLRRVRRQRAGRARDSGLGVKLSWPSSGAGSWMAILGHTTSSSLDSVGLTPLSCSIFRSCCVPGGHGGAGPNAVTSGHGRCAGGATAVRVCWRLSPLSHLTPTSLSSRIAAQSCAGSPPRMTYWTRSATHSRSARRRARTRSRTRVPSVVGTIAGPHRKTAGSRAGRTEGGRCRYEREARRRGVVAVRGRGGDATPRREQRCRCWQGFRSVRLSARPRRI